MGQTHADLLMEVPSNEWEWTLASLAMNSKQQPFQAFKRKTKYCIKAINIETEEIMQQ